MAQVRRRRGTHGVGIFFRRDELNVIKFELQIFDGFRNQISVALADVAELRRGDLDDQVLAIDVAEARGLEPGFVRVPVDFFLEGVEDSDPRIGGGCRSGK